MLKTCAVLLICLATFVEAQNPGGSGGNVDPTGTGGDKPNANNFKGNCRKNNRQCDEPDTFCAPPGHGANANPNSQWKCYYCYCNKTDQCYLGNDNKIHCNCTGSGFVGEFCNETFCNPNPCQYSATCDDVNKRCDCGGGMAGQYCESYGCDPSPCQNGGTCQLYPIITDVLVCTCTADFYGDYCEHQYNPCALPVNDENDALCVHGVCVDGIGEGEFSCNCSDGFTGEHCEIVIDPCDPNPCALGEDCVADGIYPVCISACEPNNPCQNGGTCKDNVDGNYTCICPSPFKGDNCTKSTCDDSGSSDGTCGSGGSGKVAVSVNVDVC